MTSDPDPNDRSKVPTKSLRLSVKTKGKIQVPHQEKKHNCPTDLVYSDKKGKCNNCDQLNPHKEGKCIWCDQNEVEPIDKDDLEDLGIRLPD